MTHHKDNLKNLDDLLSKINALDAASSDQYQKNVIKVLRTLAENQINSIQEFEHLKKAIDLLTLELFKLKS